MRCYAYDCDGNDDGYCGCPSDVSIDSDGSCSDYCPIPNKDKDESEEDEDD